MTSKSGSDRRRIAFRAAAVITLSLVALIGLYGCTAMPWNRETGAGTITVSITSGYGNKLIASQEVRISDRSSSLDALKTMASVETSYGGGFVKGINNLDSGNGGEHGDWFFYVNGVLPAIGSAEHLPRDGDRTWWDFHSWQGSVACSAVIGSWPAPFTSQERDADVTCRVFWDEELENEASVLRNYLEGQGARVEACGNAREFTQGDCPSIVLLSAGDTQGAPCADRYLTTSRGAFVRVESGRIIPLMADGEPSAGAEEIVCAIVATSSGTGDAAPIWFVLCEGAGGRAHAVNLLTGDEGRLEHHAGITVDGSGKRKRLPR